MNFRHLGQSGLKVSEIGLGANSFGEAVRRDIKDSTDTIHSAIDHGINFIDTSNVYAQGKSEEYIGRALRGRRTEMLIGTKFGSMRHQGPNNFGGSRNYVLRSVEESLQRLQTDYIDVYMIHRPDPRMPMDETLRTLDHLVRDGKIRYTAGCNFEGWRLVDAHWTAKHNNFAPLAASQFAYSLMTRSAEEEMITACRKLGIGVIPYLPLAAGLLTGKMNQSGSAPAGTRMAVEQHTADRWITPRNLSLVQKLDDWAQERGHTVLELAFAWLLAEPIVTTVIAGAGSPEQIRQNVNSVGWQLTATERLDVSGIVDNNPPENSGPYYSTAGYFHSPTEAAQRS